MYGIENEKVSLIMSNNICDDGTLATPSRPCTVEWLSQEDFDKVPYNNPSAYHRSDDCAKGPITAMNYLYEATKNWSNIPNIDAHYSVGRGNPLKTSGNVTTMTISIDDTITATYDNLKARLPYHRTYGYNDPHQHYSSGLLEYPYTDFLENCSSHSGVSESCLLDKGVYGYWLESATVVDSGSAVWCGYADAFINVDDISIFREMNGDDKIAGIRPVIELSKSDF